MNDPHVKALHYRVVTSKNADYKGAEPIKQTTDEFEFNLDGSRAVFEMKKHYATALEARRPVDQYLRSWDILIGIEHDPEDLYLVYEYADIIDRAPKIREGKTINLRAHIANHVMVSESVSIHISRGKYPPLPLNFRSSSDVETMYLRYKSFCQNREPLTSMAYMCLTVLEVSAGGRPEAAQQYNIDWEVLDTLGKLSSTKGSPEEIRKFRKNGTFVPLSSKEREWIRQVIKALIRRAGEYAFGQIEKLKQITMKDFPELP